MLYLRSLLYTILMISTVPFFVIPGLLLFPFPFSVRYGFYTQWSVLAMWLLKVMCGLHYKVEGAENIPKENAIIFSKHQSAWETIALQRIFPPIIWILKRELLWVPVFGWALAMLDSIGIDRSSGRKAVKQIVEKGTQKLKKGRWIIIFPEGTRTPPGTRKKYGVGGAVLAEKSGYPVIPVAHNAGEYWRRRDIVKHPGVIRVVIGPAIESKNRTAAEINKEAEDWIESTMEEITTLTNNKPETE